MSCFPRLRTISRFRMRGEDVLLFLVLVVSGLTTAVLAFNVDTDNPIVFKGPRNSYFGYSVAILENSLGTWLLIGAPRANDSSLPGVYQPGAVFQCNWRYPSSCQLVFIDNIGNERQVIPKWKNVTVQHVKDNQWMGTSIDVNTHGNSQVMVCAPRWIEKKFYVQGFQLMNGLCYESNRDLDFGESSAWPALENWKKQVHTNGYFSYGMGSLGTSAAYSKDGKFSVLGAPGLNDWAGGFVHIESDTSSKPKILELSAERDSSSYFGTSITTAKLSAEDVYTIIGGPRAGGSGKVHAYNNDFELLLAKEGSQIGSSFGATVCAVDLNGDSLDDLVVGAPLYSENMDEGRVYVYINKEFFNLELMEPVLMGSNTPGARFGSAIANVGDLNLDFYEDIAIGAPYEEDAGVVYIYNGAKFGLHIEPSQRIVGKSFGKELKAFGCSFSRPWDVDSNHYEDFAVGSFESDKVVLLRTRPVFDLHASLEVSPAVIDLNGKSNCLYNGQPWHCIEASVCLRYAGRNLPSSAELNITLQLDTNERHRGERARIFFLDESNKEVGSTRDLVTVRLDRTNCLQNYKIYTRKSRDVITPLILELAYDIASSSLDISRMTNIEPKRNKYNPTSIYKRAMFALDCGDDHVCSPKLDIKTTVLFDDEFDYLMIDYSPSFDVHIVISNTGETSYLTVVTIDYPAIVFFSTVTVAEGTTSINCLPGQSISNETIASMKCDIMTPVKSNDKVVLNARFYAYGIPYDVHKLEVKTTVSSEGHSDTINFGEKHVVLTVPVNAKTDVKFSGVSIPGQLAMPREQLTSYDKNEWLQLFHLYILHNLGPSPMPHGQITLSIPAVEWLRLINVQTETRGKTDDFSHVPVECSVSSDQDELNSSQTNKSRHITRKIDDLVSFINCESSVCFNVTCYVGLLHNYETVYINLSFAFRTDILQLLKDDNQLTVLTSGLFRQPDYMSYNSLTSGIHIVTTTSIMYKVTPGQGVHWWLLVISISSGVLLFYILVVMLWKCGFFRRKKRERLHQMLKDLDSEREILQSDSLSADSENIMVLPSFHRSSRENHVSHNPGLFYYPHLEPDHQAADPNFQRHMFFPNHSLNRRDMNHGFSQNFHTLQCNKTNHRIVNYPNSSVNGGHHHNGINLTDDNSQLNIWMAPPAASTSPPSFNNDMYLEPIESRT